MESSVECSQVTGCPPTDLSIRSSVVPTQSTHFTYADYGYHITSFEIENQEQNAPKFLLFGPICYKLLYCVTIETVPKSYKVLKPIRPTTSGKGEHIHCRCLILNRR